MRLHRGAYRLYRLTFAILASTIPLHGLLSQTSEIFKLQIGLEYEYSYYTWFSDSHVGWFYTSSDSGTINCRVIDSSLTTDSTRTWLVHQTRRLVHGWHTPLTDTVYALWDTTTLPLREITAGYHELQCTSSVWTFPEVHSDNQVTRVYRYADTSHVVTALAFSMCPGVAYLPHDSLWLSIDSSFSRRSSFYCTDDDQLGTRYVRSVALRSVTLVSVEEGPTRPTTLRLLPPYPNPFNSTTTILFVSPDQRLVRIRILDILGREVARVFDGRSQPGMSTIPWNSSSSATGMYFVLLESGTNRQAQRLLLLK